LIVANPDSDFGIELEPELDIIAERGEDMFLKQLFGGLDNDDNQVRRSESLPGKSSLPGALRIPQHPQQRTRSASRESYHKLGLISNSKDTNYSERGLEEQLIGNFDSDGSLFGETMMNRELSSELPTNGVSSEILIEQSRPTLAFIPPGPLRSPQMPVPSVERILPGMEWDPTRPAGNLPRIRMSKMKAVKFAAASGLFGVGITSLRPQNLGSEEHGRSSMQDFYQISEPHSSPESSVTAAYKLAYYEKIATSIPKAHNQDTRTISRSRSPFDGTPQVRSYWSCLVPKDRKDPTVLCFAVNNHLQAGGRVRLKCVRCMRYTAGNQRFTISKDDVMASGGVACGRQSRGKNVPYVSAEDLARGIYKPTSAGWVEIRKLLRSGNGS
jgi:hypothetical protein